MLLWEYLLAADDAEDLADPDDGWAWFGKQSWTPKETNEAGEIVGPGIPEWDKDTRRQWTLCVQSLRSVAHRQTTWRPRRPIPPTPFAWHADKICDDYL